MPDKMPETPEGWLKLLRNADIPVLKHTQRTLAALALEEEHVSSRQIAAVILHDPLMTLRVLSHMEKHRRVKQNADITTIERAIVMMGIPPFFRQFRDLPVVEDRLRAHPHALLGLLHVIGRARQASDLARELAVLRHDPEVEEIIVATLLHEVSELLMWCEAPLQMLEIQKIQHDKPGIRTAIAQQAVLHVRLSQLQQALVDDWKLPQLLQDFMDDAKAEQARVRNVLLAVNFVRHAAKGWGDPAIPDDLEAVGKLVGVPRERVIEHICRGLALPEATRQSFMERYL